MTAALQLSTERVALLGPTDVEMSDGAETSRSFVKNW